MLIAFSLPNTPCVEKLIWTRLDSAFENQNAASFFPTKHTFCRKTRLGSPGLAWTHLDSGFINQNADSFFPPKHTLCKKTRLDSAGLGWTGLDWAGLGWTWLDSAGLGWTWLDSAVKNQMLRVYAYVDDEIVFAVLKVSHS